MYSLGLDELLGECFELVSPSRSDSSLVSFATPSLETWLVTVRRKEREAGETREGHNSWQPLIPICNVCETSWKRLSCWKRERRGWKDRIQDLGLSVHRENWAVESQTCITHSRFSEFVCVFRGGGDNRKSGVGHGHVYSKLLFLPTSPSPTTFHFYRLLRCNKGPSCRMMLLFGSIKHLFRELLHSQIFIGLNETQSEISVKI
ncbi:hypothetical protein GOODEAATRI_033307 [Goodea atripinnis]|uniref:Uncharacterized protein n=1 Tax=Goodea atripinnis TaxID=208336 RepID=A0ABV0MMS2_9TELE